MEHKVSPSQIAEARRCLRSWWWQSVKGYRKPDSPSTLFGQAVHAALEHVVEHGWWPLEVDQNVLDRAQVAYDALARELGRDPSRQPRRSVEQDWSIASGNSGYPLEARGRIDLVLPVLDTIVDWKTTSDLRWIKTPDVLIDDPQVLLYSDAMVRAGRISSSSSTFLHVYTLTRGAPRAVVVRTKVTAKALGVGRKRIGDTMGRMVEVLGLDDPAPEDVPANLTACGDFGGCPHRERCFGKQQPWQGSEGVEVSDLAAKLAARRAAQAGSAPVQAPVVAVGINPPEAATPAPAAPVAVAEVVDEPAKPTIVLEYVEPPKATKTKATKQRTAGAKPGEVLLIGVLPLVHEAPHNGADGWMLGDQWLAGIAQQAAESLGVAHWGIAEYGKGKAAVMALVADACRRGDVPRYLILDRRGALADAVADILVPCYTTVFCKMG